MRILKHMEALFIGALAVAGTAAFVAESIPEANARQIPAIADHIATANKVAVVRVQASRMTEAEKQQSLIEEARAGGSGI